MHFVPDPGRRAALKSLLVSGVAALIAPPLRGQCPKPDPASEILAYLETLRRTDGGFGWHGQENAHLTPTLFSIGCYHLLDEMPPDQAAAADFVRNNHPYSLWKRFERRHIFDYQQVQALAWLGEDLSALAAPLRDLKSPRGYNQRYETGGNPPFEAEAKHFLSRKLCGLPPPGQAFTDFLADRRRDNGSYNTTPTAQGGDGNVLNTWYALEALSTTDAAPRRDNSLVGWLQSCQLPGGGFSHQPQPAIGGLDDVAYTRAAVRALSLLGAEPKDRLGCLQYLASLANHDGGFADRPGWYSNPMATYYALDALATLGRLETTAIPRPPQHSRKSLPADLNVYSIQIEAHGQGSPRETVALARALNIHLWGAKNAEPAWRDRVTALAAAENLPLTVFQSDEEYGTLIDLPGSGTFSHVADVMAPAGIDTGPSLAKAGPVGWSTFKQRRLQPLWDSGGRLNWQFGVHEDVVRLLLDESLLHGGYSTISTFHFGNIDFTTSEPFLHRWRGRLPFIALQDAHGVEPWWFADQTEGMRTLFLGSEPSWDAWLRALDNNWVAAVRHDYRTNGETWMHSGSDEVAAFVREREAGWRWWDNPSIARPLISLVALRPGEVYEAGRPERGINLRIRLAHRNSNHGLLREPLAELVRLTVNGREVRPELVSVPGRRSPNQEEDRYFLHSLGVPATDLTVEATVKNLQTGETSTRKLRVHPT